MLQAYSTNLSVAENTPVQFNNVVTKGCTVTMSGNSTINLNKCGVYCVEMDAFGEAGAVGDITLQLYKNGIAQEGAISTVTGATGDNDTLSFKALVQVQTNNTPCPCTAPVTLQLMNNGVAVTGLHANIVVTKLV